MGDEDDEHPDLDVIRLHSRVAELERTAARLEVLERLAVAAAGGASVAPVEAIRRASAAATAAAAAGREVFARSAAGLALVTDPMVEPVRRRALLDDLRYEVAEILGLAMAQPDQALLAARWAAGLAVTTPRPGADELLALAGSLLDFEAVVGSTEVAVDIADHASLRAWVAGTLAHVDAQPPAFAVFEVVGAEDHFVHVAVHGDGAPRIESVGATDASLDDELDAPTTRALEALGFRASAGCGGAPTWQRTCDQPRLVELADLVADVLRIVHGVGAGATLRAVVDAFDLPSAVEASDPGPASSPAVQACRPVLPGWLLAEAPTVAAMAEALADRVAELGEVVGLAQLQVVVHRGGTDAPPLAHIVGEPGALVVALAVPDRRAAVRLDALGWDVDGEPPTASCRWPAEQAADACWHLVTAAVAALDLRWDQPLSTSTTLHG